MSAPDGRAAPVVRPTRARASIPEQPPHGRAVPVLMLPPAIPKASIPGQQPDAGRAAVVSRRKIAGLGHRPRSRGRVALRTVGEIVVTAGVLVLMLVVWLLWWTGRSAGATATRELTRLEQQWATAAPADPAAVNGTGGPAVVATSQPAAGSPFAVLRIPRFGASWQEPVLQGTGTADLRRGVGHYAGTALPGAVGNLGIAGHRTTWGHPFGDIQALRRGDQIVIETAGGWFTYRVTGHEVVAPTQRSVLAPVPHEPGAIAARAVLTLTSCHPRFSARQRYVVHAELETSRARTGGVS